MWRTIRISLIGMLSVDPYHMVRFTRDKHLHSREHVLADDLSRMMLEPKRFAAYLGIAEMYYESDLRALAKRVAAKPDLEPENRGKYFFGALKGVVKRADWLRKVRRRRLAAARRKKKNEGRTDRKISA